MNPSRRSFLKRGGLAAGGASLAPALFAQSPDPHSPMLAKNLIGHGDFTYHADPHWGKLDPGKHPVQHCHEMVLDSRGRLLCSTVSNADTVLAYNKDGKLLEGWQLDLPEPHGLTTVGEGSDQTLLITDVTEGRVLQLDLDGRIIRELAAPDADLLAGKPYKPTETTVAANGDIYVADGYGSNLIFRYDSRGRLQGHFGGPEHFDCCHGIVVDDRTPEPTLLITSRAANNFQRWSLDGKHQHTFELPGLSICRPVIQGEETYFAVIVTQSWWRYDGMLAVLNRDMEVVSLPGGSEPPTDQNFTGVTYDNHTFMNPHDVCTDGDGNLYVPQWYSGRTYPIRLKRV
jgi:sugar lactone lactonase YvrE